MHSFSFYTVVFMVMLLTIQLYTTTNAQNTECAARDFGESSVVCVCNATYCDEIGTVEPVPAGQYVLYTSSMSGLRFQKTSNSFTTTTSTNDNDAELTETLTLDHTRVNQTIFGFGGAFTDSTGQNILKLSNATQQNLINAYFSRNGLEYSFGRVPIGGCDFSPRIYTYDDDHPDDFNLTYFQLAPEDLEYKIPMVLRALAVSSRPVRLFASPWSSPAWMKTSNSINGSGTLLGEPGGLYYQTWADYFVRFLDEYSSHGIEFWAVTAQNEPTDGTSPDFWFNSLGFTPDTQRTFVAQNLGPTLAASGHQDVKIIILDDQRDHLPAWPKHVLANDSLATPYVSGIAFHWYKNFLVPPTVLTETHDLFPDVFLLASEACEGFIPQDPNKVLLGSWERGEHYANDILKDLLHWTVGWVDWNMALNATGGYNWIPDVGGDDSAIIVDGDADEFYKQPMFYAIGHFSKFVAPGSVVIGLTSSESNATLEAIAFDNAADESTIVVVLNRSDNDVDIEIVDPNSGLIQETVPLRSFQTYIWWH